MLIRKNEEERLYWYPMIAYKADKADTGKPKCKLNLPKPDYDIMFEDPPTLADDPRTRVKLGG